MYNGPCGRDNDGREDTLARMSSPQRVRRVVQWSTGGIGRIAIRAVAERPDLELVGVWVHSAEKDGVDAGVLAGGAPLGVLATRDAERLSRSGPIASRTRRAARCAAPSASTTSVACSRRD
jgi:hypothetical protein